MWQGRQLRDIGKLVFGQVQPSQTGALRDSSQISQVVVAEIQPLQICDEAQRLNLSIYAKDSGRISQDGMQCILQIEWG